MRVAIIGCGYVGLALARRLGVLGHDVIGVRRSAPGLAAIESTGVTAIRADVTARSSLSAIPPVDAIVFTASTGGGGVEAARSVYVDGLQTVIDQFTSRSDPPTQLIFTSSTGVYGDHDGDWVDESTPVDPQTEKTAVVHKAEQIVQDAGDQGLTPTVVRFAGLYGPGRYRLTRYLEGPVTAGYLNMLHRDDAAGILQHVLESTAPPSVLLAVDDEPVDRRRLAEWLADQCNVSRPATQTVADRVADVSLSEPAKRRLQTSKRCANDRLRARGYDFTYPTFREGYEAAISAYRATH